MAKTNKGRKLFATTATAALVASAIVPVASAAEVNDINSVASYAKDAVQDLVDRGVIEGDAKGNFNPRNSVTRAEAATIFAKALDLESTGSINFSDVKSGAWYYDAIAAAVNNGVFQGQGAGKFNPSGNLTRSEAAVIYVNAFGLEGSDDLSSFKDASAVKAWAKEAIQIAVANGVLKGDDKGNLNPNANITKQDFAVMFARAEAAVVDPATNLKDALEDLKTASEKLVEKVTAENVAAAKTAVADAKEAITAVEEALKAAQEAEVVTEEEVKTIEEAITAAKAALEKAEKAVAGYEESLTVAKVESVSATNLKEVIVKFNQAVDKASAEDVDKYTVDSSVELLAATLQEDGKTVVLTVKPFSNGLVLQNQKAYKLSVKNVKAGTKTIDASNIAFTPVDNVLPEVSEVKSLGTKAIKVTFSEPVKSAATANFKLDGKSFFGTVSEGSRSVILKPYTATDLAVGSHTLEVSGVVDYAGFKSLTKEFKFEVVEDKVAPTVKAVSATLEKVTVTFSEEVDPDTISKSNVYWKSGADKKAAGSVTQIAPDVYEFDFSANSLPGYEVTLFVEGVKDYSGNQITETEVKVRAELDQTRPEVTEASISKLNNKNITLKFNKTVKIEDIKYFTLKDAKGDAVAIRTVYAAGGGTVGKEFTIETYGELSDAYTLKVVGVRDTTKLENTMSDYSATLAGKDTSAPSYESNSANSATRTIIVNFDEEMDLATLADHKNYLVTINGRSQQLPAGTEVTPVQNGEAVRIVFPEYIDNASVGINDPSKGANVTAFKLLALKDVAGNIIADFGGADILANTSLANVTAYDANTADSGKLTAKGVVKVRFNQPIGKATTSDFEVTSGTGVSISSVVADGSNVVTITLSGNVNNTALVSSVDGSAITLAVKAGNKLQTTSGNSVVQTQVPFTVKDGVKPQVELAANQTRLVIQPGTATIELPFSENLLTTAATVANYKYDLVVTNVRTGATVAPDRYETRVAGNKILIDLLGAVNDEFTVSVKANASFIQDTTLNKTVSSSQYYTQVGSIDTVAPSAPTVTAPVANVLTNVGTFTFTGAAEAGSTVKIYIDSNNNGALDSGETVAASGIAAANGTYSIATTLTANTANNFVVTATDVVGNVSATTDVAYTITHDNIVPTALANATDANSFKVVSATTATVKFSEALDAATFAANNANGFAVAGGTATLTKAELQADGVTVLLTGTDFAAGTTTIAYTAGPVKDLAGNVLATFAATATN